MKNLAILTLCLTSSLVFAGKPVPLSLNESILLAVRSNPNLESARLNEVVQKFNVYVQKWQFYPHYSLQASGVLSRNRSHGSPTIINTTGNTITGSHNYNVQPGVTLLTPIGTQLTLTANNSQTGHFNPGVSLQVVQPLMRGFGVPIVEAQLNDALDSEKIVKLNIEGTLRTTVTNVINAYLDVINARRTIEIDQEALSRSELSVKQTELFIKAGHKAGNEIITVKANVASAKTQLENDKNAMAQSRYALLTAIGIDPNTPIEFTTLNLENLINKYRIPSLNDTKQLILQNDIQYQTEQITLRGSTKRALMIAKDNARWQLNLTATGTTGNGSGGGQNAGFNSLFNGVNQAQSIGLNLQVPIDDQMLKQGIVNAKIALKQAQLALLQEKWNKETSAINGFNSVTSAKRALQFAASAKQLQLKTYNINYQKYLHGLIDSLELQTAQTQLIQAEQTLLNARINYLKALVNLDLLVGNTLKTWGLKVR